MIPTMPGRLYVVINRFGGDPNAVRYRAATMPAAPERWTAEEAATDERRWVNGDC